MFTVPGRLSQSVAPWHRINNINNKKGIFLLQERRVPLFGLQMYIYIAKVYRYGAYDILWDTLASLWSISASYLGAYVFLQKCSFWCEMCLLSMRDVPMCEAQLPLCGAQLPLCEAVRKKKKITPFFVAKFDLRTSEAHFIKKSAVRGTAATCDSLVPGDLLHGPIFCILVQAPNI